MTDTNRQSMGAARETARAIVRRVISDPDFAAQLRTDPEAAVRQAGLADWAVADFLTHDLGLEPEVGGYALADCQMTSLLGWSDDDGIVGN